MRESQQYADVACEDGKEPYWSAPSSIDMGLSSFEPLILRLTKAMSALGMFSREGLRAITEIWDTTTFSALGRSWGRPLSLTRQLVNRLIEKDLPTQCATDEHVSTLVNLWAVAYVRPRLWIDQRAAGRT